MSVNYSYFQESYYHLFYYYSYSNQVVFHVEMNEIKKNCPLRIVLPFQHNIIQVNEALNEGVKQKSQSKGAGRQFPFRHSNIPSRPSNIPSQVNNLDQWVYMPSMPTIFCLHMCKPFVVVVYHLQHLQTLGNDFLLFAIAFHYYRPQIFGLLPCFYHPMVVPILWENVFPTSKIKT